MLYADIIIDISHDKLDRYFTYIIPKEWEEQVYIGCPVDIKFGNLKKIIKGFILDLKDATEYDRDKIKPILGISPREMPVESRLIELAFFIKNRYGCTMNLALKTVLPVKSKIKEQNKKRIFLSLSKEELPAFIEHLSGQKKAYRRLLEYFLRQDIDSLDYSYAIKELKISANTLKKMQEAFIIEMRSERLFRNPIKFQLYDSNEDFVLNEEQKLAFSIFKSNYERNMHRNYLLHGITGSGKTRLYIEMIRLVISKGRKVIVLIPEINLTLQTLSRLSEVFGDRLAILNSKLSKGERYDEFERIRQSKADIILGPRSAVFAPFDDIGLIIIDEEHDSAYKNENNPRYDAREVADFLAQKSNASLVLSSATPSLLSYKRAMDKEYILLELKQRATGAKLAKIHIVDLRKELQAGNRTIFSHLLRQMIQDRLDKREQILLFINRRGYSNFVSCRSCGEVIKCPHCDVSLTLHHKEVLICHYCNYQIALPKRCTHCGSPHIAAFGLGTQKLEAFTKKEFPNARILRLDTDITSDKMYETLTAFQKHQADILIGTQMIVKGHDFKDVTLVGIMAADTMLYYNDYAAGEKSFSLMAQAEGRAGREKKAGDVVIQTYVPNHYVIESVAKQEYPLFYKKEMFYRKLMKYPPYVKMLHIIFSSKNEEVLEYATAAYAKQIDVCLQREKDVFQNIIEVIGPANADIYKIGDYYRKIIYIKSMEYDILMRLRTRMEAYVKEEKLFASVSLVYDFE